MGLETRFVDGRRYTDEMTLDLARMVLIGKVNSDLVAHLTSLGAKAVGLSGHRRRADPRRAPRSEARARGRGRPMSISGRSKALMDAGYLVVIAPAAIDAHGPAAQRERRLDRRRHGAGAGRREAGLVHRRAGRASTPTASALGADRRGGAGR